MKYTLGFIGCGNMGGALVRAATKAVEAGKIAVCDFDENKTAALSKELGVTVASAKELAENCTFLVLGVKPQGMETTLSEIAETAQKRTDLTAVTMAAGLPIASIQRMLGCQLPTIRIMPNTPVTLGAGMVLYATNGVDEKTEAAFLEAFRFAGKFDKLPEEKIDSGCALSGCGPAFVYAFAQALASGGVECGLTEEQANLYAAQTLKGAAEMLLEFGNPEALKKAVCSPGGATIEGVKSLEANDFNGVTVEAVKAAYKRTLELKK